MRASRWLQILIVAWALLGAAALGSLASDASAVGATCGCVDGALRISVTGTDFPVPSGALHLKVAMGLPEASAAAWVDVESWPFLAATLGGELRLNREWLSLRVTARQGEEDTVLALAGQAAPPAWLLYDGLPALAGGVTALAETQLRGSAGVDSVVLSPFFMGIAPVGDVTISPSVGFDLRLASDGRTLGVPETRLVSTVTAWGVEMSNTVCFTGWFDAFSSLALSVRVPNWGMAFSGSLVAMRSGGFALRAGISLEWGEVYLLQDQADTSDASCVGGVCF